MARRVASGCLVFHEGNCLLLRRSALEDTMQGLWEMPAGKIESDLDGSPRENAIRETLEEAGIALGDVAPLGEHLTDSKRFYGFLGVSDTADVELSFEHDAFVWMSVPDILAAVAADDMMVGHHTIYFLQELLDGAEGFMYEAESFAAESGDVRINYNANCPACISIMSLIGEEKLETDPANTYWGGGAYQNEVQHLQDGDWDFGDGQGRVQLHEPLLVGGIHHNLLGRAGSLLHEYNNNGNGNLLEMGENEECYECGGTGEFDCYSGCDDGKQECYACDGTGEVEDDEGEDEVCDDCDGSGEEDCNSCEGQSWCNECGGSGEFWNEEIVSGIDYWYRTNVIDYISANGDSDIRYALDRLVDGLESGQLRTTYGQEMYNDANHKLYNDLHDAIIYYVINTPNKPLPEGDTLDAETFSAEKITKDELVEYLDWLEDGEHYVFDTSPRAVRFRDLLAGDLQINSADVDFMDQDEFILLGAEGLPRGVAVNSFKTVSNVYYNGKLYRKFEGRRHRERAESIAEWMMQKLSQNPRRFDYIRFGAEDYSEQDAIADDIIGQTIFNYVQIRDYIRQNLTDEAIEFLDYNIQVAFDELIDEDMRQQVEHVMNTNRFEAEFISINNPSKFSHNYVENLEQELKRCYKEIDFLKNHVIDEDVYWIATCKPDAGGECSISIEGYEELMRLVKEGIVEIPDYSHATDELLLLRGCDCGITHEEWLESRNDFFDALNASFEAEFVSINNPFKYPSNYVGNLEQDLKQANQVIKMVREICRVNVTYDWEQWGSISPSEEFENIVEIIDEKSPANFAGENFEARYIRSLNTPRQPMPWDLEPNMTDEGMPYLTRREYDSMRKIGYTDEEIRNGYQRSYGSESFEAESTRKPARVEIKRATIDPYKLTAVFYDKDDKKIKTTHFGDERYEDYTIHKDKERLKNYNTRHGAKSAGEKWQKPMTAGALSKWILWNKPSLAGSFADYKRRFKLKGDLKAKTSGGRKRAEGFEDKVEYIIFDRKRGQAPTHIIKVMDKKLDSKTLCDMYLKGKSWNIAGVPAKVSSKDNPSGLCYKCVEKQSETFATEYTPSQTLGEYDARELALSNVATGDFFTDSLKFSTTRKAAESDEDAKKLREYEKTYGKKQAKIRMRLKRKIYKEKSMGTKAGQWSARKSQKLKREYETACERAGLKPYKTSKTEKQEDLEDWSDQDWKTSSGKKSSKTGEPYFPAKAVEALKKKGLYTKAKRQKAKATKEGKQNARYSDDIRKAVAKYRAELWE